MYFLFIIIIHFIIVFMHHTTRIKRTNNMFHGRPHHFGPNDRMFITIKHLCAFVMYIISDLPSQSFHMRCATSPCFLETALVILLARKAPTVRLKVSPSVFVIFRTVSRSSPLKNPNLCKRWISCCSLSASAVLMQY